FVSTREGVMHAEEGAEALLMSTLARLRELAQGAGLGLAELAVGWLASRPGVTSVIAGAGRPDQLRANVAAVDRDMDPGLIDATTAATEPLKEALGMNADMW